VKIGSLSLGQTMVSSNFHLVRYHGVSRKKNSWKK